MKLRNLEAPLIDLEGEEITKRMSNDDLAIALLKYGVPQGRIDDVMVAVTAEMDDGEAKRVPWTGLEVIKVALQFHEKESSFEKKADRMALAFRVMSSPAEVEIDKTDLKDLKDVIAKTFNAPIFIYRMAELFKAAEEEVAKPKAGS